MEANNAAAMREALVWMRERMNAALNEGSLDCYEVLSKIESALAEPARNCDLYNEVEDSWQDYKQFRNQAGEDIYFDMVHFWPFAKWLLAPAEERKGDGDGR